MQDGAVLLHDWPYYAANTKFFLEHGELMAFRRTARKAEALPSTNLEMSRVCLLAVTSQHHFESNLTNPFELLVKACRWQWLQTSTDNLPRTGQLFRQTNPAWLHAIYANQPNGNAWACLATLGTLTLRLIFALINSDVQTIYAVNFPTLYGQNTLIQLQMLLVRMNGTKRHYATVVLSPDPSGSNQN